MISMKAFTITYLGCLQVSLVRAAMHEIHMVLPPTEDYVQYNDGYVRGPGLIDLSGLTFTAISDPYNLADSLFDEDVYGGETYWEDEFLLYDGENESNQNDEGGRRMTENDDEMLPLDIVVLPLPSGCSKKRNGCDWADLGVGKRAPDGDIQWCCSEEAISLGLCTKEDANYGRIMIDAEKFAGDRRDLMVPKTGLFSEFMENGKFNVQKSGMYAVIYANCRDDGRDIAITGESVWKSKHGYLPGELYPFKVFFAVVTFLYFVLFVWFGRLMVVFMDQGIQVERWILVAITLGLFEMVMRSEDYFVWNHSGYRSPHIILVGVIASELKKGISRCVLIMLSMGWGVSRDTLGNSMKKIVVFGCSYILVSCMADLLLVFAVEHISVLSFKAEVEIADIIYVLDGLVKVLNVIFVCWMLSSFNHTQTHLAKLKQIRKLERINNLQLLIQIAVALAIATQAITVLDHFSGGEMVAEEFAWAKDAAGEVIYLFVLIGISCLWRPNEHSREYLYVMELSTKEDDADVEYALNKAEKDRQ